MHVSSGACRIIIFNIIFPCIFFFLYMYQVLCCCIPHDASYTLTPKRHLHQSCVTNVGAPGGVLWHRSRLTSWNNRSSGSLRQIHRAVMLNGVCHRPGRGTGALWHRHDFTSTPTSYDYQSHIASACIFPPLSVIFQHVNFHLMAPAIVHSLILLWLVMVFFPPCAFP